MHTCVRLVYVVWIDCKKTMIENQLLMKKVYFPDKKVCKIFGQFAKKQYLCSRFRDKRK